MTKEEAIEMMQLESEREQEIVGFMVVPIRGYDIERFCDEETCERFGKLDRQQKTRFLAKLTDEMLRVFEFNCEYTAYNLLYSTRDDIEIMHGVENGFDYLFDEAEKEN